MIDLVNKTILIRNHEEYENILEECRKQGYRWIGREDLDPIQFGIPCTLETDGKNTIVVHSINPHEYEFCEASDILGEKEMTAREFVEWISNCVIATCHKRQCETCVLSCNNTKNGKALCNLDNWPENIDGLVELAKTGKVDINEQVKEESNMEEFLNSLIKGKSRNEILHCIGYLIGKVKEQE